MLRYLRKGTGTRWNWLLWWRIDRGEVHWEAAHYDELPAGDTFKGWSVIFMLANAALVAGLAAINRDPLAFLDPAAMLALAVFVHQGKRWAMIGAMLVWTVEKTLQIAGNPGFIFIGLPWWAAFMHAFYMALMVERRRANPAIPVEGFEKDLGILVRGTGRLLATVAAHAWSGLRLVIRKAQRYARLRAALAKRSNR